MNDLIDNIFNFLLSSNIDVRLIIMIIAILPIAEARIAIPVALKCGLKPMQALCYGFLGSSLAVPILLLVLIPFVKMLAATKAFKKLGSSLLARFESKAQGISSGGEIKRLMGTAVFVAIPLPLTGVWTGSAIASILNLKYGKALLSIVIGNFIASGLVLIITLLFAEYINLIMAAFTLIALLTALAMLLKMLKPKKKA